MVALPSVGSRVSLRYRLPAGSAKPLTDVVGHLEAVAPQVVIRTKSGELIEVRPADVVSARELSSVPVRASEIRALEHAAALAWPGREQQWLSGWLLRAGGGFTSRANSAVPLDFSASLAALIAIIDWYRGRGLPAWLLLPERLVPVRAAGVKPTRVMVCDVTGTVAGNADLTAIPDPAWMAVYRRHVPVDVLTAVVDGEVAFASVADAAVGRGAVTTAPDGTRWVGISSVRVESARRRHGNARRVCDALLQWGAEHGATRAYVEVLEDNIAAIGLYESMGFRLHHRHRYIDAGALLTLRM
jgi:ribosomal protein S18 acetylase RimI-like enzyme